MRIVSHASASAFLARARRYLLEDEARSALVLGVAGELERYAASAQGPLLVTVEDDAEVLAVAVRTPPFPLIVDGSHAPAITALADELAVTQPQLPGVTGHVDAAEAFARAWPRPHARQRLHMRYYALRTVVAPPRPAAGALRVATDADVSWLCDWVAAFAADTGIALEDETAELRERRVAARAAAGDVFVWQHEALAVALVSVAGKTPNGVRINMVYTPPEQRGQGYASACVASLAQRMLVDNDFVCLYADAEEPGVNRIYQRLGFEAVCRSVQIRF